MHDPDDRLAGDHIWELFTPITIAPAVTARRYHRCAPWLLPAAFLAPLWIFSRPLAVAATCFTVAFPDIRNGRQFAHDIPVKAGGTICALFTYAWAAGKFAITAIVLLVATTFVAAVLTPKNEAPAEVWTCMLLAFFGVFSTAALTARALLMTYRSGMRLWIGDGINRARILFTAMFVFAFFLVAIVPFLVWLSWQNPRAGDQTYNPITTLLAFAGCMFLGPLLIVTLLDQLSQHLLAPHPSKFGSKVATVGKWQPPDHYQTEIQE